MIDLAVNVRVGPLPGWLERALRESLDGLARYPADERAVAAEELRRLARERLLALLGARGYDMYGSATWTRPATDGSTPGTRDKAPPG